MKNTENSEAFSITGLIEDLKSTDSKQRLNGIKSLSIIGNALGKERTRSELLPFITDMIEDEEDENLIELTKIIGTFLEVIGGKSYVMKIIKILEILLTYDDGQISFEAIKSLKQLFLMVNISEIESPVMEILTKLFNEESQSSRISLIQLLPSIYPFVSTSYKTSLVQYINRFSSDENIAIKKEFYSNLKLLNQLLKETNDNIRGTIIEGLIALKLSKQLSKHYEFIFNILQTLSSDENWRIKYILADKINEILLFPMLPSKIKSLIIDIIVKLIEDKDQEIRTAICLKIDTLCEKLFKDENFDKVLKQLKKLETDSITHVRASLATNLLKLCPHIGKSKTNDFIFPIFLCLLKDENHEIRLTLLKNVDKLNEVISFEIYSQSVFPSIKEILTNKNWRVRIQLMDCIPIMAKILPKETFLNNLLVIALSWLTDNVFTIREISCKVIKKLYDNYKSEEMEKKVVEKVNDMTNAINYLVRNSALFLIKEFIEENNSQEFNEKYLLPIVFKLSKDKVSNVRLSCAMILKKGAKYIKGKELIKEAQMVIDELKRDSDMEVSTIINEIE